MIVLNQLSVGPFGLTKSELKPVEILLSGVIGRSRPTSARKYVPPSQELPEWLLAESQEQQELIIVSD